MLEAEELSQLIGDIYDAALDPSRWVGVLESVCRFVGGSAGGLWFLDGVRKAAKVYYEVGTEPGYSQLYVDKYSKLDPAGAALVLLDVGEVTSNSLLIPQAELIETRFYKEWVQPQGWIDNISVVLDRTPTSAGVLSLFQHQRDGPVDDGMRQRVRLIVPHLRRAVLIGRVIDLKTAEAATFADTLDSISAGMFLVDARGRIVHANAAGHAMLAKGPLLRAAGGKLVAHEVEAEQTLLEVFANADRGDGAVGVKGIAVPLTSREGERYVAHVLPLTSGARRQAGTSFAAVAALFVHKAALEIPSPPEVIAKMFKLTPSELRVLLAIVEIGGVPETAEALGIAEGTVKTHLKRLFAKTGTTRQADLVKLVAAYASPLAG